MSKEKLVKKKEPTEEPKVIEAKVQPNPNPRITETLKPQIISVTDDTAKDISKRAIVRMIYLQYECNLIARNVLRQMLQKLEEPVPEDLVKYLVKESVK